MNTMLKEFLLNGDLWTTLGGLSLVALAGLIAVAAGTKKRLPRRGIALGVVAAAGVAGTILCGPHPNDVLVKGPGTQLLLSPFDGAEVKSALEPGQNVRALKTHGNFAYVTTPSGTAGWVEKGGVTRYVGQW